jgi:hypothetical protein
MSGLARGMVDAMRKALAGEKRSEIGTAQVCSRARRHRLSPIEAEIAAVDNEERKDYLVSLNADSQYEMLSAYFRASSAGSTR